MKRWSDPYGQGQQSSTTSSYQSAGDKYNRGNTGDNYNSAENFSQCSSFYDSSNSIKQQRRSQNGNSATIAWGDRYVEVKTNMAQKVMIIWVLNWRLLRRFEITILRYLYRHVALIICLASFLLKISQTGILSKLKNLSIFSLGTSISN